MEIISSGAVAGAGEKHLPSVLLQTRNSILSQLRANGRSPAQVRVSQFLQDQGRQLNSKILAALAVRVADDPFKKVKKMIQDLIYRLMEEANAEAAQKGWCDEELATNEQTRKAKSKEVDTLTSEIDALEAEIAKLTEDITELSAAVADLDKAMAEASELREKEKIKNTQTIKDAQAAQTEYDEFMHDSELDKTAKEKDVEHKTVK